MPALQDDELLDRGVWKLPYRSPEGYEILVAVTSRGVRLKQIVLEPGTSESRVRAWLVTVLDRYDPPPPPLRLVKPPPKPKQLTVEQLEALYRDADPVRRLIWERKRAKLFGGTFG